MGLQKLSPFISTSFLFAFPSQALAAVAPVTESDGFAQFDQLTNVFANVTSVVSTLIGFALLLMLIRGGIAYITAQGDPKALTTARASITWAIIGFVVVLAAYLIISLIAGFVQIPGIGKFCVPQGGGVPYSCP